MAKALDLYGEETIVDAQGKAHAWRKELCGRLVAMQRKNDGSWMNENSPRWCEGNPVLATATRCSRSTRDAAVDSGVRLDRVARAVTRYDVSDAGGYFSFSQYSAGMSCAILSAPFAPP